MEKSVDTSKKRQRAAAGFTIVELLIVIIVIGILASISIVSYNGVQRRAQDVRRQDDLNNVEALIAAYATQHGGVYPATTANSAANWRTVDVRTDANCFNGSAQADWVPGVGTLPQSVPNTGSGLGVDNTPGCYLYASNGVDYVLSAWNTLASPQTAKPYYRRLGFRPFQTATSTQFYTCNDNVVGGANGGYDITRDYYKHSYTLSNITSCNETPPTGA